MDIYLPIANMSVNALFILVLGGLVGILSGLFGVGGGFLTTPLLIFYGIPPSVAVASATTQITGASVSGVLAHMKRGGVDLRMGLVMIAGGLVGSLAGAGLFRLRPGERPDRCGDRPPLRRAARLDRLADAQGRGGRARLVEEARRSGPRASATIGWSPRCRSAGASMRAVSTSRRWHPSRSVSSPAS